MQLVFRQTEEFPLLARREAAMTKKRQRIVQTAIGIFALIATTAFAHTDRARDERDGTRTEVAARSSSHRSYSGASSTRTTLRSSTIGSSDEGAANGVIVAIDSETGDIYRYAYRLDNTINSANSNEQRS
jgi:hypothetical protein